MKLTGAEILMECLLEQQVDTVFGYPGGAVLNIYDALYQYADRIRHIRTAHEQGAAHAADGYARSSGKTGVCIATSGPGATNLVTGIATAYMDSVPMVAITGNVTRHLLGLDSFQEVDITGITMPVTKHNFIVQARSGIWRTRCARPLPIAQSGRKGPVLIDIPKDVTAAECEYTGREPLPPEDTPMPSERRMKAALELLMHSERPFIYAGGGVILSEAAGELHRLAAALDAPVACSLMCQGGFDQADRALHRACSACTARRRRRWRCKNCDLLCGRRHTLFRPGDLQRRPVRQPLPDYPDRHRHGRVRQKRGRRLCASGRRQGNPRTRCSRRSRSGARGLDGADHRVESGNSRSCRNAPHPDAVTPQGGARDAGCADGRRRS